MSKASRTRHFREAQLKVDRAEGARRLLELYRSREAPEGCEPTWMHPAYESLARYLAGDESELDFVDELIGSLNLPDMHVQRSIFGTRVIHDGWKIGTSTWIFMGRNSGKCRRHLHTDWIVCGRDIPEAARKILGTSDTAAWIAYSLTDPIGMTSMTSNCFGPFMSEDELTAALNADAPNGVIDNEKWSNALNAAMGQSRFLQITPDGRIVPMKFPE